MFHGFYARGFHGLYNRCVQESRTLFLKVINKLLSVFMRGLENFTDTLMNFILILKILADLKKSQF